MLYFTQLVYLKPGQQAAFDAFEAVAIPLIARHNGRLLWRIRPDTSSVIEGEAPSEIHLVTFPTEADFESFSRDPGRAEALHLKEASIDKVVLIKGSAV